jgi:hypothetical protein
MEKRVSLERVVRIMSRSTGKMVTATQISADMHDYLAFRARVEEMTISTYVRQLILADMRRNGYAIAPATEDVARKELAQIHHQNKKRTTLNSD